MQNQSQKSNKVAKAIDLVNNQKNLQKRIYNRLHENGLITDYSFSDISIYLSNVFELLKNAINAEKRFNMHHFEKKDSTFDKDAFEDIYEHIESLFKLHRQIVLLSNMFLSIQSVMKSYNDDLLVHSGDRTYEIVLEEDMMQEVGRICYEFIQTIDTVSVIMLMNDLNEYVINNDVQALVDSSSINTYNNFITTFLMSITDCLILKKED